MRVGEEDSRQLSRETRRVKKMPGQMKPERFNNDFVEKEGVVGTLRLVGKGKILFREGTEGSAGTADLENYERRRGWAGHQLEGKKCWIKKAQVCQVSP